MPPKYTPLPQLTSPIPYLTEAGLETTLLFRLSQTLPSFAAFPLLETPSGRAALTTAYVHCISISLSHGTGIVIETPTWRASEPWMQTLEYSAPAVSAANVSAIEFLMALRARGRGHAVPSNDE